MEKIIVKRNLIRISEATFKEILEAVVSNGEVYFNFKDGAKKAKVEYGGETFDVSIDGGPCRNDVIHVKDFAFFGGSPAQKHVRKRVREELQREIGLRLKAKYDVVYEDIEV